ncbi:MAG: 6-phosphogluconolactonase [Hydrogenophaga sp.]|uniref:6-phosphogluconolactonase n=1 Tax=Hydrogenophaga sp. TaxID=1904254 RepID=UPI00169A78BA|nr:6-phosphogluconolactonase [Hydrogenophaga sp.]NIM43229.1 6-phosphogluconolactonase [Hydrogenophaga sp.]NIN28297.1 6-phosphogluconolactonase [Hydrogenophaga sp.]NIN29116.1 6-phosphogluconolactonase [Hydrogenophaga sp.]NIN57432.1 6-phosphogluconolactonase [Hydrogenophaga sp.]NIO53727.1 6-phosphogluconolactonase [Hydrogenophaga sp.]
MNQHPCNTPAELAQRLAAWIGLRLHQAIEQRGHAVLAVSGGKSPVPLFEALRTQPLEWSRVSITLVDERCVPHDHADSNTALVRAHLLQQNAAAASFVPWFDGLPDTLDDKALKTLADGASHRLAREPWPWDLAILGMGEDGHTASLFPHAPGLQQALHASGPVAWTRPLNAPHARLTLTLPALLATRELVLPLIGPAKLRVYQQARLSEDDTLPISLVLHQHQTPVQVWLA